MAALLWGPLPTTAAEAGAGGLPGGTAAWIVAWFGLLLAAVCLTYVQQARMVRKKTAELRRELFERQTAEKELLASDRRLRRSLAEKEALLKEIHHRVKNNLQIVSSLLYLQEERLQDVAAAGILRDCQNRVKSMALIHEQLYGASDLSKIDFGRYLEELGGSLSDAYGRDPDRVGLSLQADDLLLGVDTAVPCGLIVNELVSNALKHAFPDDRRGTIEIVMRAAAEDRVRISVADDGIGLPEHPAESGRQSLGLRLIDTLVRQLDGDLDVETGAGTRFCITVKAPELARKES